MTHPKHVVRATLAPMLRIFAQTVALSAVALPTSHAFAQEAPAPPTSLETIPADSKARQRKQKRQALEGAAIFAGTYVVAAGMGTTILYITRGDLQSWALPLFIPVLGPIYVGGRLAVEFTQLAAQTKDMRLLAVLLAPFAYGAALVSIVDGVLQGYGIGRIATAHEDAGPKLLQNRPTTRIPGGGLKTPQVAFTPNASPTSVGFDLLGRF
jgi:hypothetical protein